MCNRFYFCNLYYIIIIQLTDPIVCPEIYVSGGGTKGENGTEKSTLNVINIKLVQLSNVLLLHTMILEYYHRVVMIIVFPNCSWIFTQARCNLSILKWALCTQVSLQFPIHPRLASNALTQALALNLEMVWL